MKSCPPPADAQGTRPGRRADRSAQRQPSGHQSVAGSDPPNEAPTSLTSVVRRTVRDMDHIEGRVDRISGADLSGADIRHVDMTGASFREVRLNGVRMRGVELSGADIDGDIFGLRLNGVEVAPLVEAELNRRHP